MRPTSRIHGSARRKSGRLLPALLLSLGSFLPSSRAQDATTSTLNTDTSALPATVPPGATPLATIVPATLNATSPTASTPPENPPELFPAATHSHTGPVHDANVFNYYFLFLFVFAALVVVLLVWLHRRKQQRKQQLRQRGQHALARDLEGWAGARRFMHGRHRPYSAAARVRRQEGLNEHGEAPPPYEPKNEATVGTVQDLGSGIAVPLRTLGRDTNDRAPPGYTTTERM